MEEIMKALGCDVLMYDDREWQIKWRKDEEGGWKHIRILSESSHRDAERGEGNCSAAQFYSLEFSTVVVPPMETE